MHVVICIKQVPDTKNVRIDPKTNTLVRQGVESITNPFDLYAIEAALQLKDSLGAKTTVITMGPPQAEESLREALSLGVDEAVLLSDRAFAGADTWATSRTLAEAIKKLGPVDLVVCGKQAIDGDTAQVGPEVATLLDLPCITYVRKIEIEDGNGTMKVERATDSGYEILRVQIPAVVTVIREIGEPRIPGLRHKIRSKKQEILVWGAEQLGLDPEEVGLQGSYTQVVKVFSPPPRGERQMLSGTVEEMARELVRILKSSNVPGF
ncbi:MAG TPA: electron transfer flavoprotein subunit beta/FixA family protein [Deltaproteobacteria bacterium]|nr:electron transfer flavoprotein subunit beta/FixA family protein [Deltaproteobacteria bacterium]